MRTLIIPSVAALCLATASCSELAVNGPYHGDIIQGAATAALRDPKSVAYQYALVDIDDCVVKHVADLDGGSFYGSFGRGSRGPAPAVMIGAGDVLQLTVFESKSGGLFIPADSGTRPGNYVTMPPVTVDNTGSIGVPYGGELKVSGKSVQEVEHEVEERLADRAIDPKVVVAITEQNASTVAVVGDVNTPKKVKITQNGERILDIIAHAGGPHFPGYETYVTLQRRGRKATIYFNNLVSNPDENIYATAGDTLYVYREPRRFVALGAVGVAVGVGASSALSGLSSLFTFDQDRLSLVEAVGKAGGLLDYQANPAQVFLYRLEARDTLQAIGLDLSGFPADQKLIPTVYRANFRDPSSYFFAQQFPMRSKDVLYAANANSVEVVKFINYATAVTGGAATVTADAAVTRKAVTYLGKGSANTY